MRMRCLQVQAIDDKQAGHWQNATLAWEADNKVIITHPSQGSVAVTVR